MDESEQSSSAGSSLQRLADTLLNTIRNRCELMALELEEEKQWIFSTFFWSAICLFCSFITVLVITFTTFVLVPDDVRWIVMIAFCVLYLAGTFVALNVVRKKLTRRTPPFSETVSELRKDIDCLKAPK